MVVTLKLFDKILADGIAQNMIPNKSAAARDWFRSMGKNQKSYTDAKLIREAPKSRLKNAPAMGKMFFFQYDPKHKATLPYYDNFPLIFMIEAGPDFFYGLNLHYLPYKQRAMLMDALYDLTNNDKMDETTKLKFTYTLLKSAAKYRWFRPCLKKYLKAHVRSRFIEIQSKEWDIALWLPIAQFSKASQSKVWSDSLKKV